MTTRTVTGLYDSYEDAARAIRNLEDAGVPDSGLGLVVNNADNRYALSDADARVDDTSATGAGASIGTVLGGGAGLLAGLGMLAIPGVGPVVAAGWLIATAVGAGVGAGAGGLLGSLVGAGVDEADAHVYAEGVRRGGTLVTARVNEAQRANVEAILSRYSGVDANTRGNEYRAGGWERFDDTAPAYTAGASPMLGAGTTAAGGLVPGAATTTAADLEPGVGLGTTGARRL